GHPWNPTVVRSDGYWLILMIVCLLWLLAVIYARHIKENNIIGIEVSGAVIFAFFSIYDGGRVQAEMELASKQNLYTLTLKKPENELVAPSLKDVHMMRSSSNGFIVSQDRRVSFIPKDEVLRIEAQSKV